MMRNRFLVLSCFAAIRCLAPASPLSAQVARVFVSVNGNDGNTCSNVATPCRTFGGGITQVDDGGEVIVLDSGSYGGTTITKGVTLNVPPGVVAFAAQPFTINAPNKEVTIRGLTLKALTLGTGTAVTFAAGLMLRIENCVFSGWSDGVDDTAPNSRLVVSQSRFRNLATYGIQVSPSSGSAAATIDATHFDEVTFIGLYVQENAQVVAQDCVFNNGSVGADVVSATNGVTSELTVRGCLFSHLGTGFEAIGLNGGAPTARLSSSVVVYCQTGLQNSGGTLESYNDNDVRGNTTQKVGTITGVTRL